MDTGFIKLFRKMLDWEWYTDYIVKDTFIHILFKANHSPKKWRGIDIRRGQLITSRKSLASDLNFSEQNIRTALKKLKSTNDIDIQTTNNFTLITVVNYSIYQDKPTDSNQPINQQDNQQLTNEQPTTNQQLTTTKELKNNKNEKNNKKKDIKDSVPLPLSPVKKLKKDLNELVTGFSTNDDVIEAMNEFIKMRKAIKKPLTERALKNIISKLSEINKSNTDEETIEILNNSITNCWNSVFELKHNEHIRKSSTSSIRKQNSTDEEIEDENTVSDEELSELLAKYD